MKVELCSCRLPSLLGLLGGAANDEGNDDDDDNGSGCGGSLLKV